MVNLAQSLPFAQSLKEFVDGVARLNLGLEDRLENMIGNLSGGQRQALTLLMATWLKPKLLLLDEHTAALDPKSADQVIKLTEEIVRREHLTTLMVTHSMHQAAHLGDRLIMMYKGRIIQMDRPSEYIAAVAIYLGFKEPFNLTDDQLQQVKKKLMEQRPLIKTFTAASSDFVKAMASGEGDLGFCPSPGVCYRIKDAGGADFGFVFPKEGTTGWVDGNMLVKGAAHRDAAIQWINSFGSPESQAALAMKSKYPVNSEQVAWFLMKIEHRGLEFGVLIAANGITGIAEHLTASHFLDEVAEHAAEGCNYLLAVDVDMDTVAGYEMSGPITVSTDFCDTMVSETIEVEVVPGACHVDTEYMLLGVSPRGCLATEQPEPPGPVQWPWDLTTGDASEHPGGHGNAFGRPNSVAAWIGCRRPQPWEAGPPSSRIAMLPWMAKPRWKKIE